MNFRAILLPILGLAVVVPELLWAQPGYMRRGPRAARQEARDSKPEEKPKEAKSKRPSRRRASSVKKDEPGAVKAGTDKASIEAYLQGRLKALKSAQREQGVFGSGMERAWAKFWSQLHEDRKQFEINMARQRLNLFDTLSSLDPSNHAATIRQFEQLQNTQIRAFEADLKSRMDGYFKQLNSDLKDFASKQEKDRVSFQSQADQAWKAQRATVKK